MHSLKSFCKILYSISKSSCANLQILRQPEKEKTPHETREARSSRNKTISDGHQHAHPEKDVFVLAKFKLIVVGKTGNWGFYCFVFCRHVARDCFDRVLNKPSREDLHEYLDSYHLRYPTEFCVEDEFADKDGNVVGYNLKDVQEEFKDKEGNAKCRDKERKEFCFSSQAMSALHEAAEAHLVIFRWVNNYRIKHLFWIFSKLRYHSKTFQVSLWDDANSLAVHAGRKTVFPKDFESAQSIRSPEQFVIDRREAQLDRDIRDLLSIRRDLRLHPRLTERQLARRHEARKNPKKNSIPRKKKDTKFRKKVAKKAPKKVARRKSWAFRLNLFKIHIWQSRSRGRSSYYPGVRQSIGGRCQQQKVDIFSIFGQTFRSSSYN